jgi:hypothetical protein
MIPISKIKWVDQKNSRPTDRAINAKTNSNTATGSGQTRIKIRVRLSGAIDWDIFIFCRTSKSTHPYQQERASITGLRLKLRESM